MFLNLIHTYVFQESSDMQLLIRMVSLGLGAWDMIDSQQFKEPKLVSADIDMSLHEAIYPSLFYCKSKLNIR